MKTKTEKIKESAMLILAVIICILLDLLFTPLVIFGVGYIGGWFMTFVAGNVLVNGLNTLFHVSWFTKDMLPVYSGTLVWISSYFHSTDGKGLADLVRTAKKNWKEIWDDSEHSADSENESIEKR